MVLDVVDVQDDFKVPYLSKVSNDMYFVDIMDINAYMLDDFPAMVDTTNICSMDDVHVANYGRRHFINVSTILNFSMTNHDISVDGIGSNGRYDV